MRCSGNQDWREPQSVTLWALQVSAITQNAAKYWFDPGSILATDYHKSDRSLDPRQTQGKTCPNLRISYLIPGQVWRLKWGVAALITAINISVYNIWIPARLQINDHYIHINEWWDRIEKGIYLLADGCLNAYFLYLVKKRLLSTGMTKYLPLFRFNAAIVVVSLSMDVCQLSRTSKPLR